MLKTKYDTDKPELENKISDVTDFVKKVKLTELENNIPDVSNLATKIALTTAENKIPDVSSLVKKTDYNTTENENKLNNHNHDKYVTTPEFKNLATDVFNARLKQVNLVTKMSNLDKKITSNEDELKRLKRNFGFIFLRNLFFDGGDGSQAYLIFQPVHIC